ncbi:MAG TPA: hypothetical protein PLI98_09125, partial [Candidatus Hydrogenedentes bacterium]|nr:hypothetical protein [Candidatus Hydrogenedentota bacterium]
MSGPSISRRGFMGGVAGAAAVQMVRTAAAQPAPAGGKIKAGVIGLGGRGNMITQLVEAHGGYQLTAVADYFPGVAEEAGR